MDFKTFSNPSGLTSLALGRNTSTSAESGARDWSSTALQGVNTVANMAQAFNKISNFLSGYKGGNSYSFPDTSGTHIYNDTEVSSSLQRTICGWKGEVAISTRPNYLIRISNKNWQVLAVSQQDLNMTVDSTWATIDYLEKVSQGQQLGLLDAAGQIMAGVSLESAITSRRIWKGTTPVEIDITLKFEAIHDEIVEVLMPTVALMQMALPTVMGTSKNKLVKAIQDKFRLLSPPGPNVGDPNGTALEGVANNPNVKKFISGGDQISVQFGLGIMPLALFNSVIVKRVTPKWDMARLSEKGIPMGAEVLVTFQTYEILTKEKLLQIFPRVAERMAK